MSAFNVSVVDLADFIPDLIEVLPPKPMTARDGTKYSTAQIKYKGKTLVLSIVDKVKSSGPFSTKVKKEGDYPKGEIRVEWSNENVNSAKIMKGYDVVYCAIFRKLAPFGPSIGQDFMMGLVAYAFPDKLDEFNPSFGKPNREVLRNILTPFCDFPTKQEGDVKTRLFDKPKESWFLLRKGKTSTPETGGTFDAYDCQFKPAGENQPSIPWAELKGDIEHTYRQEVTHIYIGPKLSIQKKIISSTLFNRTAGGNTTTEYIAGSNDVQLLNQLTLEQKAYLENMTKQFLAQAQVPQIQKPPATMPPVQTAPTPITTQSPAFTFPQPTQTTQQPVQPAPMMTMPPTPVQTTIAIPPIGGNLAPDFTTMFANIQGMSQEQVQAMMAMMHK